MKIGILTYHYVPNVGAVLQTCAAQHIFDLLNPYEEDTISVIDYRMKNKEQRYTSKGYMDYAVDQRSLLRIARFPYRIINDHRYHQERKVTIDFVEENTRLDHVNYLSELNDRYDAIIVGSDQTWNPKGFEIIRGGVANKAYLLDFFSGRRFCYGPSIGVEAFSEKEKEVYRNELNKFENYSCRELTGKKLIDDLTGKNAELVLDPTLMVDRETWNNLADENVQMRPVQKKYVLVYLAYYDKDIFDVADEVCRQYSLECIFMSTPGVADIDHRFQYEFRPEEWINRVRNAEYVITNSFHGIVFSLIFERQILIGLKEEKITSASRIRDICRILNISGRMIESSSKKNKDILLQPMDYKQINLVLTSLKKSSTQYIEKMFETMHEG